MKKTIYLFAAVLLALSFACGKKTTTLEKIEKTKTITIGIANEIPYGYKTPAGEIKGEAPDIAREIFSRMGIKNVKAVVTEFGSLIPGLKAGRFDAIAAGMYITPKRCKRAAFSLPTYKIGESFLVPKGNPHKLHSYEDVKKAKNIKLGVMAGAVEHGYAKALKIPLDRIVVFPDNFSGLEGVKSGRIHAFGGTSLTIAKLASQTDAVEMVKDFKNPVIDGKSILGYGAFVFKKEDKKLLDKFNTELKKFIGTDQHLTLIKQYGFTSANLPGSVTANELCAGK
ncbi:MAG: ectoine/hydroxyectoine ABC transporter substrate-binding protein EhuB [bacterium]|nr:ectoine/hydroxyectoine ABC transporter substrate-binding protein EhuB [bacterium]